jgi:hypothetical protein
MEIFALYDGASRLVAIRSTRLFSLFLVVFLSLTGSPNSQRTQTENGDLDRTVHTTEHS